MSKYDFNSPSPLARVRFSYANDRAPEALLNAQDGQDAALFDEMRQMLDARGWQSVPVFVDDKPALQVSGFTDPQKLMAFLDGHGYAKGKPIFTPEKQDHVSRTRGEWLQDSSLKICGWSYIIGDVALLASGLMSGRKAEALSGALYTAGGAVLARHGNVKTEHHVRDVSERTAEFLKSQACDLPESCSLSQVLKNKRTGPLHNVEHFLNTYPSQTTVGIYTLGAFTMLLSGLKHKKAWDIAYGTNSTLAGAASILIPEKKPDPNQPPPDSMVGKWWNWVQEKPLRMAGYAYILSGLAMGMSAMNEMKTNPKQKSYIFKFITAGTYLVGDVMLAISNKDHVNADGKFDADEQRRVIAMAAEAIALEPEAIRGGLANYVAGFLAQQPEIRGKAPEISQALHDQIAHIKENPWARRSAHSGEIHTGR